MNTQNQNTTNASAISEQCFEMIAAPTDSALAKAFTGAPDAVPDVLAVLNMDEAWVLKLPPVASVEALYLQQLIAGAGAPVVLPWSVATALAELGWVAECERIDGLMGDPTVHAVAFLHAARLDEVYPGFIDDGVAVGSPLPFLQSRSETFSYWLCAVGYATSELLWG